MQPMTLVSDSQYEGKYVALKSFKDNTVIASGKAPVDALKEAEKKGFADPVVVFVPQSNMTHIY